MAKDERDEIAEPTSVEDYGRFLSELAATAPARGPMAAPAPRPVAPPVSTESVQNTPPPTGAISTSVKDVIARKYGLGAGADDQALMAAQQLAQANRNTANYGQALGTIANAVSRSNKPADTSFYQGLQDQAGDEVKNVIARRQAAIQNQALAKQQELEDPNSTKSQVFQNILKRQYPGVLPADQLSQVAAGDLEDVYKPLALKEQQDTRREATKQRQQQHEDFMSLRDSQLQERIDAKAHAGVLQRVKSDKMLTDSATRAQNIANVLGNLDKTGVITPQDMADVQAIAVANMGVQGAGSAHERAERYAHTLGIKAADVEQFLFGKPVSIGAKNPMFQRYKQVMQLELGNFRDRANKRIDALTAGNKSIYSRRPDLSGDIDDLRTQTLGQLPELAQPAAAGGQKLSSQDDEAIQWAKQHSADPRAKKILQLHGM